MLTLGSHTRKPYSLTYSLFHLSLSCIVLSTSPSVTQLSHLHGGKLATLWLFTESSDPYILYHFFLRIIPTFSQETLGSFILDIFFQEMN